jgi:hypothetical protein
MSEHVSLRDPYGQAAYLAYIVRANNRYKLSRRKKANLDLRQSAAYKPDDKLNINNSYPMVDPIGGFDNTDSLQKR